MDPGVLAVFEGCPKAEWRLTSWSTACFPIKTFPTMLFQDRRPRDLKRQRGDFDSRDQVRSVRLNGV